MGETCMNKNTSPALWMVISKRRSSHSNKQGRKVEKILQQRFRSVWGQTEEGEIGSLGAFRGKYLREGDI